MSFYWKRICIDTMWLLFLVVSLLAAATATAGARGIDGFTMPCQSVDVASADTGVVMQLLVREGDMVQQGQVLAKLDNDLFVAQVTSAQHNMNLRGKLASAQAELDLRKDRLQKLIQLETRGSARPEEVARARTDLAIAEGRLLDTQEQLDLRRLEYERARLQLLRRTIRAPLTGIVTRLYKQPGEFVGPNDPHVLHIDRLDPLLAVFSAPPDQAHVLTVGDRTQIRFISTKKTVTGTVDFVAPVVDGKSGTVRIKIRIDNRAGKYFSGQPCTLVGPATLSTSSPASQPPDNPTSSIP